MLVLAFNADDAGLAVALPGVLPSERDAAAKLVAQLGRILHEQRKILR